MNIQESRQVLADAECLCASTEVDAALARMAGEITAHLADSNPVCLCVMTGGVIPAGQLLPRLDFPLQIDYLHATRYRGKTSGGELHWLHEPRLPLAGRNVLVIDDILDEGLTLAEIVAYCRAQGATAVYTAVLADKQRPRAPGGLASADFTGLYLPDRYVFGYGLDYQEYWRNAPGIYAVRGL